MKNVLFIFLMLLLSLTTHATTQYWDGSLDGDGDGIHWSDPQNWVYGG